ncbi:MULTISPECIES: hypothetical protein [unclassified Asaia]|uniref:hypothetical protein n=1 Tax=unclassified Asaia TaxID=2685023 RepID=UPI000F8DB480|nr:hypothetical protein [Asaia sp. W19]
MAAATGSSAARARGGDCLSYRIEAHAGRIHAMIAAQDDLTLADIRARLADDGHHFATGALWRFFARHLVAWKKVRSCRRAGSPGHPDTTAGVIRQASPICAPAMPS